MDYQKNLKKIKTNMSRADLVIERAARIGKLEIFSMEKVCWNFGSMTEEGWNENDGPKPDGTYDKMGLSCSDVQSIWDFYWWKPENWKQLLKAIASWAENVNEFVFESFFRQIKRDPKAWIGRVWTWVFVYNPFRVKSEGWVWVCDSRYSVLGSESWELAEDILAQEMGYADSLDYFEKTKKILYNHGNDKVKPLADKLRTEEPERVWQYFVTSNKYIQVADYMWVSENDPTCFVIDEKVTPFDLRDGWSGQGLTRPIAAWVKVMYGIDMTVEYKEQADD